MKTYSEFDINIPYGRTSGQVKTICPHCHEQRHDKRDKSLSVNLDKGVWNCHYCGWKGTLHVGERSIAKVHREYRRPSPRAISNYSSPFIQWFQNRGISLKTIQKMKINEGIQYMPQTGSKINTIQFNYYLNGELINVKYRTFDKMFMLEKDAELIPYNLDAITGKSDCIITEGEMDALSFIEIGHHNCISVPNGASNNLSYLDDFIDGWFEDKQIIYIAVDMDQKGIILRDELIRRFGSDRCRIVTYGEGCKDANEHLLKYGKESLEECLCKAKEIKLEGVFSLTDFEDSLDNLFAQGMTKGATIGHPNFDALCSFETKRLAIVTGIPGSGKSEFMDEIAERLYINHGWRTAFFSPENAPLSYHASKLIEKLTGKKFDPTKLSNQEYQEAKNVVNENFFFIYPNDDFRIGSILERAKYLIRRYGVKNLIIDPFNRLDMETGKGLETDHIRDLLRTLANFAQQNDVLIFLMAHPTKQRKTEDGKIAIPSLYDIAGLAHFYNMADYGIVVHRDRVENIVEIRVSKVRFKHMGMVGTAKMWYNVENGRYTPVIPNSTPVWNNSTHLSKTSPSVVTSTPTSSTNTEALSEPAQEVVTPPNPTDLTVMNQPSLFGNLPSDTPKIPQFYD